MSSQKSTAEARAPKRERGKLRVAALLDAGAAVFVEKGYDAATMTEIAARAGAAIGSLYQFFPSKEALADALLARYCERLVGGLRDIAERAPALGASGVADALVDLMLDLRAERAIGLALVDTMVDAPDRRAMLRGALRGGLADIVRAADPSLPAARAAAMAPMIQQILKAVPALAEEAAEAEARAAIRLYIAHAAQTSSST